MKRKKLAILGASGHGKVVADTASITGWHEVVFFDDAWPEVRVVGPWAVIGKTNKLLEIIDSFDGVVVAIGNNKIRIEKQHIFEQSKIQLVNIIHPSAVISSYSEIGLGSVIFAGAVVNAFTKIGCGCIINTSATIDHDCIIANDVHVSPGAHIGGTVHIGALTWIGIGASVKQGIHIGENVIVGAGAAVVNDIESDVTVIGVPAHQKTNK